MRFLLGLLGVILCFARDGGTARGKDGATVRTSNLEAEKNVSNVAQRNATRGPLGKSAQGSLEESPKGPRGAPKGRPGGALRADAPNASHWGTRIGASRQPPEAAMFHRPRQSQNETRRQADWSVSMRAHPFEENGNGTSSRSFMIGKENSESEHHFGRAWERDGENATRDRSHTQENRSHTRENRFRMRLNSTRGGPSRTWNGTRGERSRMPWNVSRADRSWSLSRGGPQMPWQDNRDSSLESGQKYVGSQHQKRFANSQDAQSLSTFQGNLLVSSPASASFGFPNVSQTSG